MGRFKSKAAVKLTRAERSASNKEAHRYTQSAGLSPSQGEEYKQQLLNTKLRRKRITPREKIAARKRDERETAAWNSRWEKPASEETGWSPETKAILARWRATKAQQDAFDETPEGKRILAAEKRAEERYARAIAAEERAHRRGGR